MERGQHEIGVVDLAGVKDFSLAETKTMLHRIIVTVRSILKIHRSKCGQDLRALDYRFAGLVSLWFKFGLDSVLNTLYHNFFKKKLPFFFLSFLWYFALSFFFFFSREKKE